MINYLRIDTEGTCLVCESIFSPVNTDQGSDGQTHTHSTQTSSSAAILGNPIGQGVLTRAGVGQGNVCVVTGPGRGLLVMQVQKTGQPRPFIRSVRSGKTERGVRTTLC